MCKNLVEIATEIFKANCVLFGDFILKSGHKSDFYIDLRKIISHAELLNDVTDYIYKEMRGRNINCDVICGVPYTCIPVAAVISIKSKIPLLLRRKESKSYGTKQLVEGTFKEGDKCLIVEDVMSTGSSILETIDDLKYAGLEVKDIFIILAREVNRLEEVRKKGYRIHYLFTINEFVSILRDENLITEEQASLMKCAVTYKVIPTFRHRLSYGERATIAQNKAASKLFTLMHEKHTNLCVAADLTNMENILKLADEIGPYICILKLHLSVILDKTDASAIELRKLAKEHRFVLLEDRKLADIGHVVSLQYSAISKYTNLVTAHSLTGSHALEAIQNSDGYDDEETGVFLVAQLSSAGNYITSSYTQKTIKLAEQYPSLIAGIVCQDGAIFDFPGFIQLTPGVSLDDTGDIHGQQYRTPDIVVKDQFADIAVVGRSIVNASDSVAAAKRYRTALWDQYLERINI